MRTLTVNNFARGLTEDRHGGRTAEFSFSRHFDILTYPRRLQPLRGMTLDTASTGIANMTVASNGLMYGSGTTAGNGKLFYRTGYGGADTWSALSTNQVSGVAAVFDLLVDWPDAGNVRTIHWCSTNLLVASDPAGASSVQTQALTFASMGQGFVHPKDKKLYIPYKTTSAQYIAIISPNSSPFGSYAPTGFSLPFQYRAYCLTHYGDYLAIPQTTVNGISNTGSIVSLWNRDTSLTTVDENIPWGAGSLQVLNNVNGALVGISTLSANYTGSFQDYDSVQVKVYQGGAEPILVKEIRAQHIAGSSHPSCTINPRVNYVFNNRLYFSVNIVFGDSIQPSWYGLFSCGKNSVTGEWTVVLERGATNDNSETGVIAAAQTGDFVSMVHTAAGTITSTTNGQTSSSSYGATSIYESLVNPDMAEEDTIQQKNLFAIGVNFLPLPTNASVVLKYRVDSSGDDSDWVTVKTFTTAGKTRFVATDAAGETFVAGVNYEFRIESTGGAVIKSFSYKYKADTSTNL